MSFVESFSQDLIRLSIPASLNYLSILGPCLGAILNATGAPAEETSLPYALELAVYETCTNIVQHAYCDSAGRIDLELFLEDQPQRLVIDLYDTGQAFNMADAPAPNLDVPQEHGYGLFLVRQLMDDVIYQPGNGKNHWRLIKYL
ncbi:MAG TPA: ATP-binding protein [Anaerolineales bacterium]|nr:ATP-binding protein [Anaerolineales bacterium]